MMNKTSQEAIKFCNVFSSNIDLIDLHFFLPYATHHCSSILSYEVFVSIFLEPHCINNQENEKKKKTCLSLFFQNGYGIIHVDISRLTLVSKTRIGARLSDREVL